MPRTVDFENIDIVMYSSYIKVVISATTPKTLAYGISNTALIDVNL
jgi:hypothetical protein